jgi:hypothetical protein
MKRDTLVCFLVLFVVLVSRAVSIAANPSRLLQDPDGYWEFARAIWFERSYRESAYRPPLYPLLLAPCWALGPEGRLWGAAAVHLGLGTLTVAAVLRVARLTWRSTTACVLSGLIVAIDPLLLYWAGAAMTETAATTLVAVTVWWLLDDRAPAEPFALQKRTRLFKFPKCIGAGLASGLAFLCRPATGLVCFLCSLWCLVGKDPGRGTSPRPRRLLLAGLMLGVLAPLLPWWTRNLRLAGHFVPFTTHGGYTMALGNNPTFYRLLEERGLGATYDETLLQSWQDKLRRQWEEAQPRSATAPAVTPSRMAREVQFDHFCYRVAWRSIFENPRMFVWSAAHRAWVLWRPWPSQHYDAVSRTAVGSWYLLLYGLLLISLCRWARPGACSERSCVGGLVCLGVAVVVTTVVHLVFWCDARMRAPVVPLLALLAAGAVAPRNGTLWSQKEANPRAVGSLTANEPS